MSADESGLLKTSLGSGMVRFYMRSNKTMNTANQPGLFRVMLLAGALIAPSIAQASPVMTSSQMRREAQKTRNGEFHFEANCGIDGLASLRVSREHYSAEEPAYPPDLAKCLVFGNQDQARYICLCADLQDPVTGTISGDKIPTLGDPGDFDPFDSLRDLCTTQFQATCGPFAEPVEAHCGSYHGECSVTARGNQRDGGLNSVSGDCECMDNDTAWFISQELKQDIALDKAQADDLCEAQLASCEGVFAPVFHDFQSKNADAYKQTEFGCAFGGDIRYDECMLVHREGDANAEYQCYCSGTDAQGEVAVASEFVADKLAGACQAQLVACKAFDPVDEDGWPDDEDDWPDDDDDGDDDWPDDDDDDDEPSLGDIFDMLGCRATPSSNLGPHTLFGFAALIGLGAFIRRRREN